MKIPVFVLVLLISLDGAHHAFGTNRRSRMSNFWRTQLSRKRSPENERSFRQAESQTESSSSSQNSQSNQSSQSQTPSRPSGKDCTEAGFFPTPGSCLHFYRCVDWNHDGSFYSAFHFTCPVGTVFDDALDVCNYPHAAKRSECFASDERPVFPSSTTLSTPSWQPQSSTSPSTPSKPVSDPTPSPGSFICVSDSKYRRHPQHCNQYYYCNSNEVRNIPIFTCPLELVFDEVNQICARGEGELIKDCNLIPYSTPEPVPTVGTNSTEASDTTPSVTDSSVDISTQKTWEVDPESLFDCPAPGYYPFEGDCIRFYKCVETDLSQLKGLLYKCPDGFGYSEVKHRCLRLNELPPCQRIPQETHLRVIETATPLYPDDLAWFFKKN